MQTATVAHLPISYNANPSAVPFHDSLAQVKALMGPVGSGKSLAAIMDFFVLAFEATVPIRGLVIRESWPQLRDSTLVTWNEWLEPVSVWRADDRQEVLTIPGRDGVVRSHTLDFRHAQNAAGASKFLSTEYAFIWMEECVPAFDVGRAIIGAGLSNEILEVALTRQRQRGAHRLHIVLTFNPPSKFHWCHEVFVAPSETEKGRAELAGKGFAFFAQPAFENERHLPPNYYQRLLQQLSPELATRFVHGKPVTIYPGKPVYPMILDGYHIVDEVPVLPKLGLVTMHDFGRTPAVEIAQVTPEGQMRVVLELQLWGVSTHTLAEMLTRALRDEFPEHRWLRGWGDPAGQNPTETDDTTSFQILASKGFALQPGAEGFTARREAVMLRAACNVGREPALLISKSRCPMLAEGLLGGYRFPKSHDGQIGQNALKNDFSHSANAFEYGVSGEFSYLTGERLQTDPVTTGRLIPRYSPLSTRPRSVGSWMSR